MSRWRPRATVAAVVYREGRYLLVEESDPVSGRRVLNQPAGHLEPGESLAAAARREVFEEMGWEVELLAVIGVSRYAPGPSDLTFLRTTFLARPRHRVVGAVIDPAIEASHWLAYEAIRARSATLRSPLVLAAVERHRAGDYFPLGILFDA